MPPIITGIHHVTAFASRPDANLRFYTETLALRLVKRTVNFDDPSSLHLYYADHTGSPGTIFTTFPHPHARHADHANADIARTTFAVPPGTLQFWRDRLATRDITTTTDPTPFSERILFEDHDGLPLALLESTPAPPHTPNATPDVPADRAITGIHSIAMRIPDPAETSAYLTEILGFTPLPSHDTWLALGWPTSSQLIELIPDNNPESTRYGAGVVHHVAWRVPDDQTHTLVRQRLIDADIPVTPILDRNYFKSIYFRVPPGIVFEIATEPPGFTADEPLEQLGSSLKLPPHLETRRDELEQHFASQLA